MIETKLSVCVLQFNSNYENLDGTGILQTEDVDKFMFRVNKPVGFGNYYCFINSIQKEVLCRDIPTVTCFNNYNHNKSDS